MVRVTDDGYYIGVWFVPGDGEKDFFAVAMHDGPNTLVQCRFRYYRPDPAMNPFEDNDEKHWYEMRIAGHDDEATIQKLDAITEHLHQAGFGREPVEKLLVQGGSKKFMEVCASAKFMHFKFEPGKVGV